MEILVFVKQVPDDFVKIGLDGAGQPAVSGVERVNNAFDTYAVELAVRYKESHGGSVTVATVGGGESVNGLKNLLAVGADRAYLLTAGADADESAMAACLAGAVRQCQEAAGVTFDLILCGKESTDKISSQVGAMLAEELGLPFVSSAIEVEEAGGRLTVKQETEEGYCLYEAAAPAVLTVAKPGYDPRYPTIKSKLAARKAQIPALTASMPEERRVVCLGWAEPPKRQAGVKLQEKEAAEAAAKAVAMMADAKVL